MKIMKFTAAVAAMSLALTLSQAQEYTVKWKKTMMDASRTGVKISSADDVKASMGEIRGTKYYAPNGKVFKKGVTPKVARVMLDAQPEMADVKQVVAYSTNAMSVEYPESALSDWFVDLLIGQCAEITG